MKSIVLLIAITASVSLIPSGSGQGLNLLRNYFKQYFQSYSPKTVRSYTLYGNGQNQPADYQAGLPYPYESQGKVSRLMYPASSMSAQKKQLYDDNSSVDYANIGQNRPLHQVKGSEGLVRLSSGQMSVIPQSLYNAKLPVLERSAVVGPSERNPPSTLVKSETAYNNNINEMNQNGQQSFLPFDKYENDDKVVRSPEISVKSSESE